MEASLSYEGFCPNCGREAILDDETGWCLECTGAHLASDDIVICASCGSRFEKDPWHPYIKHCANCRKTLRDSEVKEYSDRLGISLSAARKKVSEAKRPRCLSCTDPIKGGKTGISRFCTKKPECRRARRKYRWKRERGIPAEEALKQTLEEIHNIRVADGSTDAKAG